MKSLRTFFLASLVAFTCVFLASCGSRPSSKLHKAAVPDADAFLYFDSCKLAEVILDLDEVFSDDFREKLEEKSYSDMEGDEIEQLQKDFLKAIKTLDLKVMVSTNIEEGQTAATCQVGKDIPLYVLYKGAAAAAKSLENIGGSDARNFAEFFKHSIMPVKNENLLVVGDEEVIAAVAENLNDGGEPLSKDLLTGIPKNSFFYGGCALKEDSPASGAIAFLGLADCMEDAEVVNFGIERAGKGKLRLVVNVIYEDKDAAKDKLSDVEDVVEEFLDKAEEQLDEAAEQIVDALKKTTVKRDGKAVRVELVVDLKDIQEDLEKICSEMMDSFEGGGRGHGKNSCINNCKQLELGILLYEADNNHFPDSLLELVDDSYIEFDQLSCPDSYDDYLYFGNKGLSSYSAYSPSHAIMVVCEHEHKKGELLVGFVDGHVESVPKAKVEKAVKNCDEGEFPVLK